MFLHKIAFVTLIAAATFSCQNASAVCFGRGEEIYFVADTKLKDASGGPLRLARKQTILCFLLPYSVVNDGLVLQPNGERKKYYPMPNAAEIAKFQDAGLLPKPLPLAELDIWDIIFGHWIFAVPAVILVLFAWAYLSTLWERRVARTKGR